MLVFMGSCWVIAMKYSNVRALEIEREKYNHQIAKTPRLSHLWFPGRGGGLGNKQTWAGIGGGQ